MLAYAYNKFIFWYNVYNFLNILSFLAKRQIFRSIPAGKMHSNIFPEKKYWWLSIAYFIALGFQQWNPYLYKKNGLQLDVHV